jgi:hypothetical protein
MISSLAMQLEYDQTANIYTYAKIYHNKRPGVWTTYDDIRQIYRILTFLPNDLNLLKQTELRTEFDDTMTATPDLYSRICSNGSISTHLDSNNTTQTVLANQNGGGVIVKMNNDDSDEVSVVVCDNGNSKNMENGVLPK